MNIVDFLYANALRTLWSNPHADNNAGFKTCKLTVPSGGIGIVYLPFGDIALPPTNKRYMLVELGDVPLNLIGLETTFPDWVPITTLLTRFQTMVIGFSQIGRAHV